jgi:hypothetical protein
LVDFSVFISPPKDTLVAVLKGYFDDSEKRKGNTFSLAGYVGTVEAWTKLEIDWRKVLKDCGAAYSHMNECAHFRGEFEGWGKNRRTRFLRKLIGVISSSGLHGIGAVIFLDDLKRVNSERDRHIEAYPLCLFMCMVELSLLYPQDGIDLILDRVNECESKIGDARIYAENDKYYPECGDTIKLSCLAKKGPSFKDIPGLQAADLAAYELCLHYSRQKAWFQKKKPKLKPSEWMISSVLWNLNHSWTSDEKKRNEKFWPYQRKSLAHLSVATDIDGAVWDYTALCGVDSARGGIWNVSVSERI